MAVTIYDIAAEAGVSIATVSRVFNSYPRVAEPTRQRVFDVANALGYEPHASAQSLARRTPHLVSAVMPMLANYCYVEIMRGMQETIAGTTYELLTFSSAAPQTVDDQLDRALQKGLAGGVMLYSTFISDTRAERLLRSGQSVVLVDSFHPQFDSVYVDNEQGGYLAAKELMGQGAQRPAIIMANPDCPPAAQRLMGFRRGLKEHGVTLEQEYIYATTTPAESGFNEESGCNGTTTLMKLGARRPDAIFATSDVQALGVMRTARTLGIKIPDDLLLIGFDDIKISEYVGLSTLRQPMYDIGKLAVQRLLARMNRPAGKPEHTVFAPELKQRVTTGHSGK